MKCVYHDKEYSVLDGCPDCAKGKIATHHKIEGHSADCIIIDDYDDLVGEAAYYDKPEMLDGYKKSK